MLSAVEDGLEQCLGPLAGGGPIERRVVEPDPMMHREIEALQAVGEAVRQAARPTLSPVVSAANERRLLARVAELRASATRTLPARSGRAASSNGSPAEGRSR